MAALRVVVVHFAPGEEEGGERGGVAAYVALTVLVVFTGVVVFVF